jgi:malic enzyme
MAITAAKALADYVKPEELTTENILPKMTDREVFADVAEAVARQAVFDNVARVNHAPNFVRETTMRDINNTRNLIDRMDVTPPSKEILSNILNDVIKKIMNS